MNEIKRPHCDYKYTDDDMERSPHDLWALCPTEEDLILRCPKCHEEFIVQGSYEPVYETYKTWDEWNNR